MEKDLDDIFSNLDNSMVKRVFSNISATIFFKDKNGKYVFCTHPYKHSDAFSLNGKTDLAVRKNKQNAQIAHDTDIEIFEKGISKKYVIETTINEQKLYLQIEKNPVFDDNGNIIGIAGLVNDITESVNKIKSLEELNRTDAMTKLYNYGYLEEWINTKNNQLAYPLSIISADCNKLKTINDTYGHTAGDEYIKLSADLLKKCLPNNSLIFRTGGDEFVAILINTTKVETRKYVRRIREVAKTISVHEDELSIAIGYCTLENYEENLLNGLNLADKAMYIEKEKAHKKVLSLKKI